MSDAVLTENLPEIHEIDSSCLGLVATTDQVWDQEKVYELESQIKKAISLGVFPEMKNDVTHEFCNGMYARTLFIPAGGLLTGAVHKDESFFLVRSGIIIITTDAGTAEVSSGFMSVTKPGTKRAGIALTDCFVTTFHPNSINETDPDRIWDMYTVNSTLKLEEK